MAPSVLEGIAAAGDLAGPEAVAVATLDPQGGGPEAGLTYRELLGAAERLAGGLAEMGLRVGETVGVFLPNITQWLVVELAAARLGLRIAPINTKFRSSEVAHILSVSQPQAVVVATGFLQLDLLGILDEALSAMSATQPARLIEVPLGAPSGRPGVVLLDDLVDTGARRPAEPVPTDLDRPLNMLFSSGTTSSPKVVQHGQGAMMVRLPAAAQRFDIHPGDVVLCALPVCGAWGLAVSLATLLAGAKLLLAPVFNGDDIARVIAENGVTHFHGGDDMVRAILDSPALDPAMATSWRSATFGNFSGKDPADLVSSRPGMEQLEISGAYGSSEAIPFVSADPPGGSAEDRVTAGGPLVDPTTEFRIVDPATGAPCAPGCSGELLLRGPTIAREYVGNPEMTAASFDRDGWFHTGDLARLKDGERLVFLGRLKDSLRLRGFLVDPSEIEEFLTTVPGVAGAQVVGVDDLSSAEVPVAFLVRATGAAEDLIDDQALAERARAACRASLAAFKVPVAFLVVDEFPMVDSPNGRKVKRHELRERARAVIAP